MPAATSAAGTVWLCRPGASGDPCTADLTTTVVQASGATSVTHADPAVAPKFDCFYIYPTVSRETTPNSDLRVQKAEITTAAEQASRFSQVCRVWAPMYRQITLSELVPAYLNPRTLAADMATAYASLSSGFGDYLAHFNGGRPLIFIGHSQGAALLILLLRRLVDNNAALRRRLVMAIILGGNVEVRTGSLVGGSFSHIPVCTSAGESGCIIAYSTFPGVPPPASLFGRPGQGVSLMSGETAKTSLQVACVNPAAIGGGTAMLEPYFLSQGLAATPWVEFPGMYKATCEDSGGASWLQVSKVTGSSDPRPAVEETDGPDWGFHVEDVNLGLGNLVTDVAAAEASWSATHAAGG
jgi:hypothetical protein